MWSHHHFHAHTALTLGFLVGLSAQQDGQAGVYWLFPEKNEVLTYHHNDVVNVTWTSPFPTPILITFCKGTNIDQVKSTDVSGYNASALITLDFTYDDANCWFDLKPDLDGGKGSNSEAFSCKIIRRRLTCHKNGVDTDTQGLSADISETGDEATIGLLSSSTAVPVSTSSVKSTSTTSTSSDLSSTLSGDTTTATTTAAAGADGTRGSATRTNLAATTTSSMTGTPAATTAVGAANDSSGGLSVGAQAGIGVGVGIAAIGIGAIAVLMFLRRRRRGFVMDEKFHSSGPSMTPSSNNVVPPSHYQAYESGDHLTVYGHPQTADPSKYSFPPSFPPPRSERHELGHESAPQELESGTYPTHELPTSRYNY
ncbi:hypothetical protein AB5N19_04044 [Seiridium cardinale]